jgi:hypothetical protein
VAKPPHGNRYSEIQVKSCRNFTYVYIVKEKLPLADNRLVCYLQFEDGRLPDCYIIPSTAWEHPNAVLVDRPYDKPGQYSAPEWGISVSKKNIILLEPHRAEKYFAIPQAM